MNFNVSSPGSSLLLAITEHSLGKQETRTSLLASGLRKTTVVDSSWGDFSVISNISTLQMAQIRFFFFFPIFQHHFQYFKYLSFHQGKYHSFDEKLLWPILKIVKWLSGLKIISRSFSKVGTTSDF